ncbi:MAG: hypothetical protein GTO02_07735, partial [Candidatus Dadabacteria bacterium]|nr:hypothetical protein [Candidatus Dadabacteria bacterium]
QEVVEDKSKLDRVVIKDFLKSAMTDNTEVFHPKTNKPLVGKVRKHIPSDVLVNEFIVKDIWDDILKELEDDS